MRLARLVAGYTRLSSASTIIAVGFYERDDRFWLGLLDTRNGTRTRFCAGGEAGVR